MIRIKKQSTFFFLLGTLLAASPALVSCHKESTEITSKEKEAAQKEISDLGKTIVNDFEKLDVQSGLKACLNSPDYLAINEDGTSSNYEDMKKRAINGYKRVANIKITTVKEEFRFLTKDKVLYTWFGKSEAQLKTGEKYKRESSISSMLFSKINNEWKIVYDHGSSSPLIKL